MEPFDWSRFITRINISAPRETIYALWATQEGMESWFLRLSQYSRTGTALKEKRSFVQKGDTYLWRWYGYADDVSEAGEILEANGPDLFKFSFGAAGNCTVSFKEEEGEQVVELLQDEIPVTDEGRHQWHLGCKTGWTFYLANLKSILEGGVDLRNKNEKLSRMINA